uniref:NADH dehydrogenase [ubiquinone] 1 alpha subcomplex subunit 13 n=1 Tax=Trichuris muris TaxID=70415 RepID=A0A5S6Q9L1_TRIMR
MTCKYVWSITGCNRWNARMERLLRGKYENYQEMPPIGGYARIFFARTYPKVGIPWWKFVICGTGMITVGALAYKGSQRYCR